MTPILSLAAALLMAGTVTTSVPAPGMAIGSVEAHHGVIYDSPKPGSTTTGSFAIKNAGNNADTLVNVACPLADATTLVDASGQPGGNITVQPGQDVSLSSKGLHLVLAGIHFGVSRGSTVPCTLSFSGAGDIQVLLYEAVPPTAKS